MAKISRRGVVGIAATGVAAGLVGRFVWPIARASELAASRQPIVLSELVTPADTQMIGRFSSWLKASGVSRDGPVKNLVYNFYDANERKGSWVYPMLSGKAILWFARRGAISEARAVVATLLRWQQTDQNRPATRPRRHDDDEDSGLGHRTGLR